ncbi:M4 family metallopeptidase [Streptomyces sp. NPDC002004]
MTARISRRGTKLTIATAVVAGALATAGLATGASAQPVQHSAASSQEASPLALSAGERAGLIMAADAKAGATAEHLGLGAKEKLVVRDVVKDADGTTHTRYERTYDGMPVLGGDLVVHTAKDGSTQGVDKATSKSVAVATGSGSLAAEAAPKGARKVVWAASGTPKLAYEKVVQGTEDDGTPQKLHIITDAKTGKKLYQYNAIETGVGKSQYSGSVTIGTKKSGSSYSMTDDTRGGHKTYNLKNGESGRGTLFKDADDKWGNGTTSNAATAGVDAAYGAQATWDFYKNTFGRKGIRNDGKAAYSRVHYGSSYINAFWDDSCFCMTYGDGEGDKKPLTSLDVAGHEMTHGVTSATAGLEYSDESGGLNEATSDIMGTAVEFSAKNAKDVGDYLIGEKIDINGDGSPLRYMDKPSKDGGSADYWYSGVGDLDVHNSSGVANHFFYLLSEGSGKKIINGVTYNSPTKDGRSVTGIGRSKAVKIWYKALTSYMTSTTDYHKARTATLKAASALYGGTGSTEYKAVNRAWAAVNVK